jgi:hypothetical protein
VDRRLAAVTALGLGVAAALAVLLWPGRHVPVPRQHLPATHRPAWRADVVLGRLSLRARAVASPDAGEVADALVLLALALRSGLGLPEALHEVQLGSRGRVRRDLASVVAALQWARSAPEAWGFASPVWRQVAQAWEVAVQTGSAPAEQVERVAQRLRDGQERDRERRAARAGVLLVLPLGFGFLPSFVCTAVVPVVLAVASGVVGG